MYYKIEFYIFITLVLFLYVFDLIFQVKVSSTMEFQSLCLQAANTRKQVEKANEPCQRSHIGCIIHVVTPQTEKSSAQLVGKINFIDLASKLADQSFCLLSKKL